MKNYLHFLAHQLKGWPQQNYYLFFFSLGCQVMTLVNDKITWITVITFIGTTLGVLCILAINAAKSVNGWLGILSAICFIIVGFSANNTSVLVNSLPTLLLWIFQFCSLLIGILTWSPKSGNSLVRPGLLLFFQQLLFT